MDPSESLQHWLETSLRPRLERLTARRRPGLPAPQVLVVAPGVRFSFGEVDQPFHTASAGKPFVAVAAARLARQGLLSLDAPLGDLTPDIDLSALPAAPGVVLSRDLTLAHLLSHRSGLPDPVDPPRGYSTECSLDRIMRRPGRRWDPAEVVAQCAGLPPLGRPGERFAYGDANYALALCVLQGVTGLPAHEVLSTQVFRPAQMGSTGQPHSTATDEELAAVDIAPVWVKGMEVSHARALSAGAADGGAVTTLEDMVRFQEALHEAELVDQVLLARMVRPRSRLRAGIHYGTGLATIRFGEFMPLVLRNLPEPVGGLGLWAVHCFFYPRRRAHVIMNLHSTAQMRRSFALHTMIARRLARLPRTSLPR
ncbi:serine hydrolase domain-containing protein [Actinomyces sp. ZJ308]|uniref:serine hydrolase domain-containing protein n=1 Tax=Actinomyces sp. ZJ308 TaxID=2708342 RepID=UPI00141F219E|nr:serine hydrolase domain-containing protein [Actinomyces sp. ZJ308]